MSEPLYPRLDFVTDPRTLWERLEAGWDWLGIDAEGEFVVGYPGRAAPRTRPPAVTIVEPGVREGEHGVRVDRPAGPASERWYASEAEAKEELVRTADVLRRRPEGRPSITLIQRIERGEVVEEVFIQT